MGTRIETAMFAAHMTQTSLAEAMGVTPQAVQQWVTNKTAPKGQRLKKLVQVLGCDLNWLLTGEDYIDDQAIRPPLTHQSDDMAAGGETRPPIIDEQDWKALPPKARALVEDFLNKTSSGQLSESKIKLLQNMIDEFSQE